MTRNIKENDRDRQDSAINTWENEGGSINSTKSNAWLNMHHNEPPSTGWSRVRHVILIVGILTLLAWWLWPQ